MPRTGLVLVVAGGLLAACAATAPTPPADEAPWKASGAGEVVTAAPDAGGVLSVRNCPTLAEATAAIPAITGGPDANGVPFKSMVLQCSYPLPGRDVQGRPAGISILVFDAQFEGRETWDWSFDAQAGNRTPVPDLGDSAFVTTENGGRDVWVNAGRFGLHLLGPPGLPLPEVVALARAAVAGLSKPAR